MKEKWRNTPPPPTTTTKNLSEKLLSYRLRGARVDVYNNFLTAWKASVWTSNGRRLSYCTPFLCPTGVSKLRRGYAVWAEYCIIFHFSGVCQTGVMIMKIITLKLKATRQDTRKHAHWPWIQCGANNGAQSKQLWFWAFKLWLVHFENVFYLSAVSTYQWTWWVVSKHWEIINI